MIDTHIIYYFYVNICINYVIYGLHVISIHKTLPNNNNNNNNMYR